MAKSSDVLFEIGDRKKATNRDRNATTVPKSLEVRAPTNPSEVEFFVAEQQGQGHKNIFFWISTAYYCCLR